nr:hypothetical protein [Tanacetum cinerariifolium]
KSNASEGFAQIIDFLSGSYINYALKVSPHIYISCIKQFWNTAVVKRSGDVTRLQALVDKKKIVISEDDIREILRLDDAEGVQVLDKCSALVLRVEGLEFANTAQQLEILKLKARVKKLERLNKVVLAAKPAVVNISAAKPATKPKVLKIVPAALTVSIRKRKGLVIRDPEEELHDDTPAETQSAKDKGKGILVEDPKPMKKKDQIAMDAEFDANMRFLLKSKEEMEKEQEEIIKSINETPAQKAAKRRRLRKQAKEAEDLKKQLEVVADEDDDVFVEATLIGTKVSVVNYEIVMINNKPREDLEDLWKIMQARFFTSKPTNFTDDYLLVTLKNMFEKTNAQDVIWRSQQTEHGQALKYPLSKFTLEQLVNVARIQVKEESEMSLELLRFTRQQLLEYQQE